MKVSIGVTGSEQYENKILIKDTIFKLKQTFKDDLCIISRGCQKGADVYIKKFALQFCCNYAEVSPSYLSKNLYSIVQREEYYNQKFSVRDIFKRNLQLIEHCDMLIVFQYNEDKFVEYLIKKAKEKNKKIKVFTKLEKI